MHVSWTKIRTRRGFWFDSFYFFDTNARCLVVDDKVFQCFLDNTILGSFETDTLVVHGVRWISRLELGSNINEILLYKVRALFNFPESANYSTCLESFQVHVSNGMEWYSRRSYFCKSRGICFEKCNEILKKIWVPEERYFFYRWDRDL